MRTNEPALDRMIPETETSVIAAIGPLNALGEANSHLAFDKTTEDIRIDFTSRNVHECTNSLYDIPDRNEIDAWPQPTIEDETNFNVRIGPAGGDRGYSRFTGEKKANFFSNFGSRMFKFISFDVAALHLSGEVEFKHLTLRILLNKNYDYSFDIFNIEK